jgi:hypothetical protein
MTSIIVGIVVFFLPILVVLVILCIYRYISYKRAKRLFDAYQPRSLRKSGIVYDHNEDTLKPDHKMHL